MQKSRSKLLVFLLVLALTLSNVAGLYSIWPASRQVLAEDLLDESAESEAADPSPLETFEQDTALLPPDSTVRVLIELSDDDGLYSDNEATGFSLFSLAQLFGAKNPEPLTTEEAQDQTLREIEDLGIDFQLENQYDLLLNAVAGSINLEDSKKLAQLPQVKHVELVQSFACPTSWAEPNLYTSPGMVFADFVQDSGYKGLGTVIAVLDSGADVAHPDFNLDNLPEGTVLPLNQAKIESLVATGGLKAAASANASTLYRSPKVPFAFNYADKKTDVYDPAGSPTGMHGMHVAGIAAANGDPTKGGVRGISPQAQLLIMKVFDDKGHTDNAVYIDAIEDAVKLGANVINLSLGSPAGGSTRPDSLLNKTIDKARAIGCVVVAAAGNAGTNSYLDKPNASMPDMGIVSSPAVENHTLAVASMNNVLTYTRPIELVGEGVNPFILGKPGQDKPMTDILDEELLVIDCGLAKNLEEIPDSVQGNVALIERGGNTFVEKINNAAQKGARLALIYNNTTDDAIEMFVKDTHIPSMLIKQADGDRLKDFIERTSGQGKIVIRNEYKSIRTPESGKMSNFSSWGLSPGGDIKPEITAPGGNIYSTFNDGKYGLMSGTSMATPHVSGAVALLNMRFSPNSSKPLPAFIEVGHRSDVVKNLLMCTADPFVDHRENGFPVYTSPRQQGAGVLNLKRAMQAYTTLSAKNDADLEYCKVNLGDLKTDSLSFSLVLRNYSAEPISFANCRVTLTTDLVQNGKFVLRPSYIYTLDLAQNYVVPAASATEPGVLEIPISLDSSQYKDKLEGLADLMPNGYFLEGFVEFVAADPAQHPNVSIPFVGFRNVEYSWGELPILEPPIYEFNIPYETPAYYDESLGYNNNQFTQFMTYVNGDIGDSYKLATHNGEVVLGEVTKEGDAHRSFRLDEDNPMCLSPNFDKKNEFLWGRLVFQRNFHSFEAYVTDVNGRELTTFWSYKAQPGEFLYKNANIPNSFLKSSYEPFAWHCDVDGKTLRDGKYYIGFRGQSLSQAGTDQYQKLGGPYPLIIDTKGPRATRNSTYDPATGMIRLDLTDGDVGSGITEIKVYGPDQKLITAEDQEQLTYKVAPGTDPRTIRIELMDKAYNISKFFLEDALGQTAPTGQLLVVANLANKQVYVDQYRLYRIVNGEKVLMPLNLSDFETWENGRVRTYYDGQGSYPEGDYEVEILDEGINYKVSQGRYRGVDSKKTYALQGSQTQKVSIMEGQPSRVDFRFREVKGQYSLLYVKSELKADGYPGFRHFRATNLETGKVYEAQQENLDRDLYYFGSVPHGRYRIEAFDVREGWYSVPELIDHNHNREASLKIQFASRLERGSITVKSIAAKENIDQSLLDQIRYSFTHKLTGASFGPEANGSLPYGEYVVRPDYIPDGIQKVSLQEIVLLDAETPEKELTFSYDKAPDKQVGSLSFELVDNQGKPSALVLGQDIRFSVFDGDGREVTDLDHLEYGRYKVKLEEVKAGYEVILDARYPKDDNTFFIVDKATNVVKVEVSKLSDKYPAAKLRVELTAPADIDPQDFTTLKVQIINSSGQDIATDALTWDQDVLSFTSTESLPADNYTVTIDGAPAGYYVEPYRKEVTLAPKEADTTVTLTFELKTGAQVLAILHPNNGEADRTLALVKGQVLELPEVQKKNADFAGWYLDPELTEPFTEDALAAAVGTIELYAKWDLHKIVLQEAGTAAPEGYVEVIFSSGEYGHLSLIKPNLPLFSKVRQISYWVLPERTTWKDFYPYLPEVQSLAGWYFTSWQPSINAPDEVISEACRIEAQYEPTVKLLEAGTTEVPAGFTLLRFHADESGQDPARGRLSLSLNGEEHGGSDMAFQVYDKALWRDLLAYLPQVLSEDPSQFAFSSWSPQLPEETMPIHKLYSREFTALYREVNSVIVRDPLDTELPPAGYQRLRFSINPENRDKASFTAYNDVGQWVSDLDTVVMDVQENLTWEQLQASLPVVQIKADATDQWEFAGWTPELPADNTTISQSSILNYTATLQEVTNPPTPPTPPTPAEDDWLIDSDYNPKQFSEDLEGNIDWDQLTGLNKVLPEGLKLVCIKKYDHKAPSLELVVKETESQGSEWTWSIPLPAEKIENLDAKANGLYLSLNKDTNIDKDTLKQQILAAAEAHYLDKAMEEKIKEDDFNKLLADIDQLKSQNQAKWTSVRVEFTKPATSQSEANSIQPLALAAESADSITDTAVTQATELYQLLVNDPIWGPAQDMAGLEAEALQAQIYNLICEKLSQGPESSHLLEAIVSIDIAAATDDASVGAAQILFEDESSLTLYFPILSIPEEATEPTLSPKQSEAAPQPDLPENTEASVAVEAGGEPETEALTPEQELDQLSESNGSETEEAADASQNESEESTNPDLSTNAEDLEQTTGLEPQEASSEQTEDSSLAEESDPQSLGQDAGLSNWSTAPGKLRLLYTASDLENEPQLYRYRVEMENEEDPDSKPEAERNADTEYSIKVPILLVGHSSPGPDPEPSDKPVAPSVNEDVLPSANEPIHSGDETIYPPINIVPASINGAQDLDGVSSVTEGALAAAEKAVQEPAFEKITALPRTGAALPSTGEKDLGSDLSIVFLSLGTILLLKKRRQS